MAKRAIYVRTEGKVVHDADNVGNGHRGLARVTASAGGSAGAGVGPALAA